MDLTRIDGVEAYTALKVISEVGTDMTKWPSAKHFASWLGLSPHNRITGGKVISSKTKASANGRRRPCGWQPTRYTAPTAPWAPFCAGRRPIWARPRPSLPRPTNWPGSSTPCCATDTDTWTPARSTMSISITKGPCTPPGVLAAQLGYQLVPITDVQTLDMPHRSDLVTA